MGYIAYDLNGNVIANILPRESERLVLELLTTAMTIVEHVYPDLGHTVAASCLSATLSLGYVSPEEMLETMDSLPITLNVKGEMHACKYYHWHTGLFHGKTTVYIVPGNNVLLGLGFLLKGITDLKPSALNMALKVLPTPTGRIYREILGLLASCLAERGEDCEGAENSYIVETTLLELYHTGALSAVRKKGRGQPQFFRDLGKGTQPLLFPDIGRPLFESVRT